MPKTVNYVYPKEYLSRISNSIHFLLSLLPLYTNTRISIIPYNQMYT